MPQSSNRTSIERHRRQISSSKRRNAHVKKGKTFNLSLETAMGGRIQATNANNSVKLLNFYHVFPSKTYSEPYVRQKSVATILREADADWKKNGLALSTGTLAGDWKALKAWLKRKF